VATAKIAALIAGALTLAVLAIGLTVDIAAIAPARRLLAFQFRGVPAEPAVAATVFVHNLHALLAIGGALLVAQMPYLGGRAAVERTEWIRRCACDAALAAGIAANVMVIGVSFGAYGTRMIRAALPHGPVELAAYSLGLALYLQGRRRALPARHVLAVSALSTSLLAAAAVLETFVNV
jgi:ABC-type arginine transport system permease subunit